MQHWKGVIMAVSILAICDGLTLAQDNKGFKAKDRYATRSGGVKWAVIIGINDYNDDGITDLDFAVNDAKKLYDLLIDKNFGGFKTGNVRLITDDTEIKPTREDILVALKSLEDNAGPKDTIFIFFSGHGIEEEGESYFFTRDTRHNIVADTAVARSRFDRTMNRTQAKIQVMFFDACHSGARKDKSGSGAMGPDLANYIEQQVEGRVMLSSCGLDEVAYEDPKSRHGIFTKYLIDGLRGRADDNGDGVVSASEASNYTSTSVKTWAFQNGKKQNPRMRANVSGQIILTSNREGELLSRLSAETDALATQLQQIQQDRDRAERNQDAAEIAETKRRQAELENRLRQAEADQEAEEMREQQARKQRQQEARQRELQAIRDQQVRQQARQEQARKERLQRQIEAERRKREAERAASMSLSEALDKAEQIRLQISAVRPQVESEIEEQIAAIPKPQRIRTPGKGEFEKQAAYRARIDRDKQREKDATSRYNREVDQIRSKLEVEVRTRKEAYQQALQPLTEADFVFNEGELELDLGAYDAEEETFPNATISPKRDTPLRDFSWDFAVPVDQAKKLKSSVQNGTVEIRLHARLNSHSRNGVKTQGIVIKDYTQNSKQFVYPTPRLSISSNPSRADVFIDGQRVGTTPFDQSQLPLGRHEVKVSKRFSLDYGDYQPSETKTVEVSPGDQSVSFDLPTPPSLRVTSSPSGATVILNDREIGSTPSTLNLSPGSYRVKVNKDFEVDYGEYQSTKTKTVSVGSGDSESLSFNFTHPPSLRVTSSPSGATVMVNEQRVGTTPSILNLPPGKHAIQLSGGPAYTRPMEAVTLPPNGETDLSFDLRLRAGYRVKRRMGMLWRSSLVPGWGQFHGGRGGWGTVFMLTTVGSVWGFRNAHQQATKAIADYDRLVGVYREAFTPDEFDETRFDEAFDEAKVLYDQAKKAQSTERSFAIGVAVVWGVNLAHTYLTRLKSPPIIQQVTPTPRLEVVAEPNSESPRIRLSMRF